MTSDRLSYSEKMALRERVKELTCLYGIAQIAGRPGVSLEEMLQDIVELLPSAWQYPEIAFARITLDGTSYETPGFCESREKQTADITVNDRARGVIEIVYTEQKPALDEGPFLKEERNLIDEVARQLALIIERRQAEQDKLRLHDQLRHADRLATIGMLAAGVCSSRTQRAPGKCPGICPTGEKMPRRPRVSEARHRKDRDSLFASEGDYPETAGFCSTKAAQENAGQSQSSGAGQSLFLRGSLCQRGDRTPSDPLCGPARNHSRSCTVESSSR